VYQYKIVSAFIAIMCLFNTSCSVNKNRSLLQNDCAVKEVKAVIEEFPNYIFHLLTLGGIVPEYPEYIYLYKDFILTDDQQYLYANRNLLAWGDGNSGPLTQLFLFLPGYINLQSQLDINEYFDLLNNSLKNETFNEFIQKYDFYFKDLELWGGPTDIASYLQSFIQYTDEILRIGEIYKNNFQAYHLNVWPAEFYNIEYVYKEKPTVNIVNYDTTYHQIYTDIYNSNDNICPTDLLTKGLEINYAQRN
jgi:hypothetical protein